MKRRLGAALLSSVALTGLSAPSAASETQNYSYDALGRLTGSTISGGPNNMIGTATCFDPAGNRTRYTTGAGVTSCGSTSTPTPSPTPTPSNTPPVAVNDSSSGLCNTTKIVDVVANDYDPDGHTPLSLVSVTGGTNTDASVYSSTSLAVTGYVAGTEDIYYVVKDSLGATATGRLTYTTTGTAQQCYQ
jgi:YD repeat-containing protein